MSEQAKTESTTAPAAAAPAAAPAAPAVDEKHIAAVAEEAVKKAAKSTVDKTAEEVMREVGRRLAGDEEKKKAPVDPILKAFADDPTKFVHALIETTAQVVDERTTEKSKRNAVANAALEKVSKEYPEVREYLDYANAELDKLRASEPNMSEPERHEKALKTVASRLKLKSYSAAEQEFITNRAAFPSGGSSGVGREKSKPAPDSLEAAQDVFRSRREKFEAVTKTKTPAAA